ncbi:hypothetical protein Tco_0662674 [Tanacetum coccineum]
MTKAQDQRSYNVKEQAYNKDKDQVSRTQRQSNLHKSKEARFKDLASGEIVSLKILSQKWKLGHSVGNPRSLQYLGCNRLEWVSGSSEDYNRELEARIATMETQLHRMEWLRQDADDHAVRHIMRTQTLEAGARVDTLEDTASRLYRPFVHHLAIMYGMLSIMGETQLALP